MFDETHREETTVAQSSQEGEYAENEKKRKLSYSEVHVLPQYDRQSKPWVSWHEAVCIDEETGEKFAVMIKQFVRVKGDTPTMAVNRLTDAHDEIATTVQFAAIGDDRFVEVVEYSLDEENTYLVFRKYLGKTLYHAIINQSKGEKNIPPFTADDALAFVHRIGGALAVMHHQDVYHQDLKLTNILLGEEGIASAVLSDFDLTSTMYPYAAGTLRYMSPDAINHYSHEDFEKYSLAKRDIYAFACMVYEFISVGYNPFGAAHNQLIRQNKDYTMNDVRTIIAKLKKFLPERMYVPLVNRDVRFLRESQLSAVDAIMQNALEINGIENQYDTIEDFVDVMTHAIMDNQ